MSSDIFPASLGDAVGLLNQVYEYNEARTIHQLGLSSVDLHLAIGRLSELEGSFSQARKTTVNNAAGLA